MTTKLTFNRHYGVRQALAAMFLDTERRGSMVRAKMERVQSSYEENELGHIMRAILRGKELQCHPGSKKWEFLRKWSLGDFDDNFWSRENISYRDWAEKHVAREMMRNGLRQPKQRRRFARRKAEHYLIRVLRAHELNTGERMPEYEGELKPGMLSMETLAEVSPDDAA